MNVGIFYFRSLYSQSISSISVGKFSDLLLNRGYNTNLGILKNDDFAFNRNQIKKILANDIIIYKTNYKDFEYGIRFFEYIQKLYPNKKIYITGPFANLNKNRILNKYQFIDVIFNIQDMNDIEILFPIIKNTKIEKNSIVYGIDREIEFEEKGKYINLEASTGCIYNCSFCHVNILNYPKSFVDVNLLVDEIDYLVNTMGKKYLIFNDSVFWKNKGDSERILKLIELIKSKKIKFYFMIYLSLTVKIPIEIINGLKEIGLIRVFFGVENISKKFQISNHKYVSEEDTKNFIKILEERNITYHIGFILFSYDTTYDELLMNLKFLKEIKKLFRPGILVEKMRILPGSENSDILFNSEDRIDQAYNYVIKDEKVENCYKLICKYFSKINIRYFEHFFSSLNIAISILKRKGIEKDFENEIILYEKLFDKINQTIYISLKKIFIDLKIEPIDKCTLLDLYSESEIMYINFTNKLYDIAPDVFMMLPHGKEDINI